MTINPKFSFRRHYEKGAGDIVMWTLRGPSGGIHIWAQYARRDETFMGDRCYGGIEVHHKRKPSKHSPDEAPIKNCWLTGCDCWPDGSSLYFSERIQPMIESVPIGENIEVLNPYMEGEMLSWYYSHLSREDFPEIEPEFL